MTAAYRCPRGHTWGPAGDHAAACPVCGGTAVGPAPHVVAVAPHAASGGSDTTAFLHPDPPSTAPDPSFASLAGLSPGPLAPASRASDASSATPRAIPRPTVPGYEILSELGRGGMGVVYKARQVSLNRTVALKMILSGAHAGATERDRFRREAEAAAAFQHPHIVQIFEIGEAAGHPYLALEVVVGGSLAQHLDGTPWPPAEAARLVELLARAMHFAHERGIVHRDLKPGNILVEGVRGQESGDRKNRPSTPLARLSPAACSLSPKVTDFGLAKRLDGDDGATQTGTVLGTPSYIAPEQASGKGHGVGPAADVYALGAVLYELLTGRPPFRGQTPLDTVLQVLHDDPVPPKRLHPKVPRDLETVCLKALAKTPGRRYGSALALASDLRRFLDGEPIKARPLGKWGRAVKWAKRHPALAVLWGVSTAAVLAFVIVLTTAYAKVRELADQKAAEAEKAKQATHLAARSAEEAEAARQDAVRQADELRREADRTRRSAYALQLAQVAALVERDPTRARGLLDDPLRCPPGLRDFTWHYLHRLGRRDDRVYADHGEPLYCAAYSPDGAVVATAGRDHTVRIWDPRTGFTLLKLLGHTGRVLGVAFGPDGDVLASVGSDGTVRLWALPATVTGFDGGNSVFRFALRRLTPPAEVGPAVTLEGAHDDEVNAVAFHPDGRTLATGGADGAVRLWDLGGWRRPAADAGAVGGAGAWAATRDHARNSPTARPVWETRMLDGHLGPVLCLSYAANGSRLATGGSDGAVRVWEGDGSALVRVVPKQADEPVLAVAFTPDGKRLAATNNAASPTVLVWNAETWAAPRKLVGHTAAVHALAVGPDGQLLASAGFDRTVRLWDLDDGRERGVLHGHGGGVRAASFCPDRRTLVTAGLDGTARVWQVGVRPFDGADAGGGPATVAAAASANGETLVTADEANTVRVWELDAVGRGRRVPDAVQVRGVLPTALLLQKKLPSRVLSAAVTPDGRTVLVGCDDGLHAWRLPVLPAVTGGGAGRPKVPLPVQELKAIRTPRPVYGLVPGPGGRAFAVVTEEGVRLWDARLVRPLSNGLVVAAADVREVAFGPDGATLAAAVGGDLRVVETDSGKVLADAPDAHAGASLDAVAFDPAGRTLATADGAGLVKLWAFDPAAGKLRPRATLTAHTQAVPTLAFSPDGRTLASGGWDRGVVLWDPVTGQERATLTGHADRVLGVRFAADGGALMTTGRDGAVKRWRAEAAGP